MFTGDRTWTTIDNEATDEIAFRFSLKLNRRARQNSNRVHSGNEEFFDSHLAVNRVPSERYPMVD